MPSDVVARVCAPRQVFDEDIVSADDSLGFTDLSPSKLAALLDMPPDEAGQNYTLPLTTKGDVTINVALLDAIVPSYREALTMAAKPVVDQVLQIRRVPVLAAELRRRCTSVTIKITLHSASDLMAADVDLLGRGTTSDPYVNFELAGELQQSKTKWKTLHPVWEEEFSFTKTMEELETDEDGFLNLEVFDDDIVSADDPIGAAALPIAALIKQAGGEATPYTLPLSTKGTVSISVEVEPLHEPPWLDVTIAVTKPWLRAIRAFILYYRMPYDRTIWSKLRDPVYIVMMYVAASPYVAVRGTFFTVYLACIISEMEEFQVPRLEQMLPRHRWTLPPPCP